MSHPRGNQWAPFKMRPDMDDDYDEKFPWTVGLEFAGGSGPRLLVWFETEQAAADFIRDEIVGAGLAEG